jgi:hypothetical protein
MPRKDIKQVDDVAREYKMTAPERLRFGEFLEEEKRLGYGGSKNQQGDFTYEELRRKARDFLGTDENDG